MSKKEYIDSVNKIKVGDKMKKETLNKMKKEFEGKKSYKRIYIYGPIVAVFILMLVVATPMAIDRLKSKNLEEEPSKVIAKTGDLPKVENFDNLYKILELDKDSNSYRNGVKGVISENAVEQSVTDSMKQQDYKGESNKSNESSSDYSKTNTQVEGVDEADIVKTDGEYIYYVSSRKIVVVNSKDPKSLKIVSEVEYKAKNNESFYPTELYINNNKLIVIGTKNVYQNTSSGNEQEIMPLDIDMSYYPYASNIYTACKIYDVSIKENPNLEREVEIEGSYLTSRMIGDNVYFLANKYIYTYRYYDTKKNDMDENSFKPQYKDTAVSQDVKCIEFTDMSYFPGSTDKSYLNIAGFNINNKEAVNIETYLGAGNNVYASDKSLYVTNTKYEYKESKIGEILGYSQDYKITTNIYKFNLDNAKISYSSVGKVSGNVLNQFSMDEKDGYFRIATTNSKSRSSRSNVNNLYILNENLKVVGKTEDLAKGEKIYSVRFMGNRAYIVTFVETDPLFVIDLSNPNEPKVLGELKIPGYSKYLHPYDETHLIGFGEDTEVVNYGYGNVVRTTGMKMALFDVTNPSKPKEKYSVKIGDRGTYSELLDNHKALLFSKEKNIIAFPITISKEAGNYKENLKFQGAIVYGLDLEKGFKLKGQIAHMKITNGYGSYDYNKAVERIIYIKDSLYTLSQGLIKSSDMNTMEEQGTVKIKVEEQVYYPYIME